MKPILIYDTETTGLPDWHKPSEDPCQPHIVQPAAMLCDDDGGDILGSMNVIIRPDGWTIPDDVAAIHGITTEKAMACGVSLNIALGLFVTLWDRCEFRVAHNESFDARILRIGFSRENLGEDGLRDRWKEGPAFCTAHKSCPIVNLPPTETMMMAGRRSPKTPNLTEAYRFFTGKELVRAHNGAADVMGCKAVYFAIKDYGASPAPSALAGVA